MGPAESMGWADWTYRGVPRLAARTFADASSGGCAKLAFVGENTGRELLDRVLAGVPAGESPLTHVRDLPERTASCVPWPDWVPEAVRQAFERCGVDSPW